MPAAAVPLNIDLYNKSIAYTNTIFGTTTSAYRSMTIVKRVGRKVREIYCYRTSRYKTLDQGEMDKCDRLYKE